MNIIVIFIVISCLIASSVLLLTSGYVKNNNDYSGSLMFNDTNDYDYNERSSSLKLLRRSDFLVNNKYPGPNTRCFSCEKQMLKGKEYSSRPTKCFSCEQQVGSFGNPTKCFSCGG